MNSKNKEYCLQSIDQMMMKIMNNFIKTIFKLINIRFIVLKKIRNNLLNKLMYKRMINFQNWFQKIYILLINQINQLKMLMNNLSKKKIVLFIQSNIQSNFIKLNLIN